MSKDKSEFLHILNALFGFPPGLADDPIEDFPDYLKRISKMGDLAKLSALTERLSLLGVMDPKEAEMIMRKIEDLANEAKSVLKDYENLDANDDSDEADCDCDFCTLSQGLEFDEDENSVRARLKKKHDEIRTQRRAEDASKDFYIILMQDLFRGSRKREMKGIAFGPFKKHIAGWKLHLLENRIARYSKKKKGNMSDFMKMRKGASPAGYKWNFVCSDTREKDRTSVLFKSLNSKKSSFGFCVVREDEFSGAEILERRALQDWSLCVDKKIKSTWNIELIDKIISGFKYNQ